MTPSEPNAEQIAYWNAEEARHCDVEVDPIAESILLGGGGSLDDAVDFLRSTGMARALFAAAPTDVMARAIDAVVFALEPHVTAEGVRLGAAGWLVTATT